MRKRSELAIASGVISAFFGKALCLVVNPRETEEIETGCLQEWSDWRHQKILLACYFMIGCFCTF